jgi:CRISPR-associated protein Cas2
MIDKQYWVIAYDISNDRRRQRVAKTLEKYGIRSNFSVFECFVTESQLMLIQKRIKKFIDTSDDSVLYYYLCKSCINKRAGIGRMPSLNPEVIIV